GERDQAWTEPFARGRLHPNSCRYGRRTLAARSGGHGSRLRIERGHGYPNGACESGRRAGWTLRSRCVAFASPQLSPMRCGSLRGFGCATTASGANRVGSMMTQPALAPTAVPDPAAPIANGASGSSSKRRVHFAAALGLAIFFAIFDTLMNFPLWIGSPVNRALMLEWLGFNLVVCLAFAPSLFVAALAADGATSRGVPYVIAWGTAALSACAFATAF